MFFLEDDFVVSKKNHHFRYWTACIAHVQHKTEIEILLPSTVIILPPISYLMIISFVQAEVQRLPFSFLFLILSLLDVVVRLSLERTRCHLIVII